MGVRAMTALMWARAGFALGCLMACVGVGILAGLGWALVVGGIVAAVSCLLLVEVPPAGEPRRGTSA